MIKQFFLLVALVGLSMSAAFSQENTENVEHVNWMNFEDLEAALKKEPRPIIVDIYTTWCGPCKMMYKNTYGNEVIAKYLNDNFYVLKLNAEDKNTITFQGQEFKWQAGGRNGVNQLAGAITGNQLRAYPTTVFLTEEIEIIQLIPGYIQAPEFEPIIHYFGEGAYKNQVPWKEFQEKFESSL